jgi:hypothetical protein
MDEWKTGGTIRRMSTHESVVNCICQLTHDSAVQYPVEYMADDGNISHRQQRL